MKTKIIASMNQKGGVGKTLSTTLLAEYFALVKNKKVLLVDLDMQCNTTDQWVGMEQHGSAVGSQLPPKHPSFDPQFNDVNERSSIADIFYDLSVLPYPTWLDGSVSPNGCVDVLCGHPQKLEEINNEFARSDEQIDKRVHNRIKAFLHSEGVQNEYDIILLDTGPSRNPVFYAAMRSATHILIPFKPEKKDIQGIAAMLQLFRQELYSRSNDDPSISLIGLLPNMVRRTKLHESNLTLMEKAHQPLLFPQSSWLMNLTAFPERDEKNSRPKSIFELKDGSMAKQQATTMAEFVAEKINIL